MKILKYFAALLLLATVSTYAQSGDSKALASGKPEETSRAVVDPKQKALYLRTLGNITFQQSPIGKLGLNEREKATVMEGFKDGLDGKPLPDDFAEFAIPMQNFLQSAATEYQAKLIQENEAAAKKYFAKLDKDPSFKKTASGLYYKIITPGKGPKPTEADTVKIDYEGRLIDGKIFDSSKQRGEPAEFPLEGVILGFAEGLKLIGTGGKIELCIPAKLAYGDAEIPGIPPGSALVFDVDMLKIMPTAAPAPMLELDEALVIDELPTAAPTPAPTRESEEEGLVIDEQLPTVAPTPVNEGTNNPQMTGTQRGTS